jgi:hypothetical protein
VLSVSERATLAAVEIEDADRLLLAALFEPLDVAHQAQRRAQHMTNPERDRAGMQLREVAVEQVFDDGFLPGGEDRLGNLPAGREGLARQRQLAARPRELEFELPAFAQHDEAALGAGHLDGRIDDQREDIVENAARAERAQTLEQSRHVADFAHGGDRAPLLRRRVIADEEDDLRVVGLAQLDLVAVREHLLVGPLAVDERAEPRRAVAEAKDAVLGDDFRVHARNARTRNAHVGLAAAPQGHQWLVQRNHALPERVSDQKARRRRVCRGGSVHTGLAFSSPICTSSPVKS